ncbi:hypothetical protein H5410_036731 [Solanum commersonii]|uniref:Uncharacterized protein n=1 Tax=Solanum commersonii TaxID=4109 RepID=A0A9J5Y4C5_SOLCO|nr:hypothetical protein H5410_036731 [Solanum commersonii]
MDQAQWEEISPISSVCSHSLGGASLAKDCYEFPDIGSPLHKYYSGQDSLGLCINDSYRVEYWSCPKIGDAQSPAPMDITRTKGPDTEFGPILITIERHRRDELIMARMYGLEMLGHQNGYFASTDMQLGDVEKCYPLNAQEKALLGINPEFRVTVDDDILTDEDLLRTCSYVDSDSDEVVDPA